MLANPSGTSHVVHSGNPFYKGRKWARPQEQGVPAKGFQSMDFYRRKLYVFGGADQYGQASNTLYEYSIGAKMKNF